MWRYWQRQAGVTVVETMIAFMILAAAFPPVFGLIGLLNWSSADSRAYLSGFAAAQREISWIKAKCRNELEDLLSTTDVDYQYNPNAATTCRNYPTSTGEREIWRPVPDTTVPNMRYKIEIDRDEREVAAAGTLVKIVAQVEWQRTFTKRRSTGRLAMPGLIFSDDSSYTYNRER